jgi:hypothetical protein
MKLVEPDPSARKSLTTDFNHFVRTLTRTQRVFAHMRCDGEQGLRHQFDHYVRTAGNVLQAMSIPGDLRALGAYRQFKEFSDRFETQFPAIIEHMHGELNKALTDIHFQVGLMNAELGIDLYNDMRLSLHAKPHVVTSLNIMRLRNLNTKIDNLDGIRDAAEKAVINLFPARQTLSM